MEIILVAIALIIRIILAFWFNAIAEDKGYEGRKYFWIVFFFAEFAAAYIAALPDIVLENRVEKLEKELRQLRREHSATDAKAESPASLPQSCGTHRETATATAVREGYVLCDNCGQEQRAGRAICFKCGARFE